jgi:hypothetical protein
MKLIHHLSAGSFARCEPGEALAELFEWGGMVPVCGIEYQLQALRTLQIGAHPCSGDGGASLDISLPIGDRFGQKT